MDAIGPDVAREPGVSGNQQDKAPPSGDPGQQACLADLTLPPEMTQDDSGPLRQGARHAQGVRRAGRVGEEEKAGQVSGQMGRSPSRGEPELALPGLPVQFSAHE